MAWHLIIIPPPNPRRLPGPTLERPCEIRRVRIAQQFADALDLEVGGGQQVAAVAAADVIQNLFVAQALFMQAPAQGSGCQAQLVGKLLGGGVAVLFQHQVRADLAGDVVVGFGQCAFPLTLGQRLGQAFGVGGGQGLVQPRGIAAQEHTGAGHVEPDPRHLVLATLVSRGFGPPQPDFPFTGLHRLHKLHATHNAGQDGAEHHFPQRLGQRHFRFDFEEQLVFGLADGHQHTAPPQVPESLQNRDGFPWGRSAHQGVAQAAVRGQGQAQAVVEPQRGVANGCMHRSEHVEGLQVGDAAGGVIQCTGGQAGLLQYVSGFRAQLPRHFYKHAGVGHGLVRLLGPAGQVSRNACRLGVAQGWPPMTSALSAKHLTEAGP